MKKATWVNNLSMVTQLGVAMVTPILLCTFIGTLIDEKFHRTPLFTIIFILLGTAAGFRNLFYSASKQANKNVRQAEKNEKEDRHE